MAWMRQLNAFQMKIVRSRPDVRAERTRKESMYAVTRSTRTPRKEYIVVGSRSWSRLVCGAILMGIGSGAGAGAGERD